MIFDSQEELWFSWYLDELKESGYVDSYKIHPEPYLLAAVFSFSYDKPLKTQTKTLTSNLLSPHIYSPDFKINWNKNAKGIFYATIKDKVNLKKVMFVAQEIEDGYNNYSSIVEIKAGFSKFHAGREFSINQKWMMQKFGIYVQKIIISNKKGLFKDTFCPEKYLTTDKSGKDRKLHFHPKMLKDFESKSYDKLG